MTMEYRLNKDSKSWDDNDYDDLCTKIKSQFKLSDLTIEHNDNELDDINDIRDEYEDYDDDPNFKALHLNIKGTANEMNDNVTNIPSNPTIDPESSPESYVYCISIHF